MSSVVVASAAVDPLFSVIRTYLSELADMKIGRKEHGNQKIGNKNREYNMTRSYPVGRPARSSRKIEVAA